MTAVLPAPYDTFVQRLAWGVEVHDPIRDTLVHRAVVTAETPGRFVPHGNGRFAITYGRGRLPSRLRFRVSVPTEQYVPRRFEIPLITESVLDAFAGADSDLRIRRTSRRIALMPGATYPAVAGATVIRGRVTRGGQPERWARIDVAAPALAAGVISRATSDSDGEFVVVIGPIAGLAALAAGADVAVMITVSARDTLPDRDVVDPERTDPFWDVPVELLPTSAATMPPPLDGVASGVSDAVGLRVSALGPAARTFRIGTVTSIPTVTFI